MSGARRAELGLDAEAQPDPDRESQWGASAGAPIRASNADTQLGWLRDNNRCGSTKQRRNISLLESGKPDPRCVRANPIDHGAHPVRALWRQMLLKAKRAKGGDRIYGKDLLRRAIGKKRDRNGDEPAHEVRVAVATVVQDPPAFRVRRWLAFQPNLADAAANFVEVVVGLRAQRLERMSQFEDITISILPVVERGKIVAYAINH